MAAIYKHVCFNSHLKSEKVLDPLIGGIKIVMHAAYEKVEEPQFKYLATLIEAVALLDDSLKAVRYTSVFVALFFCQN